MLKKMIMLVLVLSFAASASAAVIVEHVGQNDPCDEGFTILSYTSGSGTGVGGNDGEDYWELTTDAENAYAYASENVIDFGALGDFTATVRGKTVSNDGSLDNVSMLVAVGPAWSMLHIDGTEYQTYQIVRDAGVFSAYIDGAPTAFDFYGEYAADYAVFGFGDNVTSGEGAVGRYSYASVEGGIHIIPEPATMVLLGLGGLLLRRKR